METKYSDEEIITVIKKLQKNPDINNNLIHYKLFHHINKGHWIIDMNKVLEKNRINLRRKKINKLKI